MRNVILLMHVSLDGFVARTDGDIPEEIARLKQQPGKHLLMIGSTATAHTFMQLGLIDEYRLNVNPVVLGSGIPLFAGLQHPINLQLVQARAYDSGVVGLRYQKG